MNHKIRNVLSLIVALHWAISSVADADNRGSGKQPNSAKPNIVFIFADDLAFDAVGAYGCREIKTPNIDRLASRGCTFTHAYNMGSYSGAVCVASRHMLVTGRSVWNAQVASKNLDNDYVSKRSLWPQLMASAGYETYFTGKWHIRTKPENIFDHVKHVRPGMPGATPEGYDRPRDDKEDTWKPWDKSKGGFWKGGKHWSEVLADDAIEFIKTASQNENPYFMYLAFNAPHDPRQSPREYVEAYPISKVALPQPFYADYPFQIGCNRIRDEKLGPFPRTERAIKVNRAEYYAIITHLDDQIGRILKSLEKNDQVDNTIIVFTADHGLSCGHHGLLGKQNMFDPSVRVPFIVSGPDIPQNQQRSSRIYMQDIMPTTLEIANVNIPEAVEFKSLRGLLENDGANHYDAIYGGYLDHQRMVTKGDFKLVVYPKIKKTLLFNLNDDPNEAKNLADDSQQAPKIAELKQELKNLQTQFSDTVEIE